MLHSGPILPSTTKTKLKGQGIFLSLFLFLGGIGGLFQIIPSIVILLSERQSQDFSFPLLLLNIIEGSLWIAALVAFSGRKIWTIKIVWAGIIITGIRLIADLVSIYIETRNFSLNDAFGLAIFVGAITIFWPRFLALLKSYLSAQTVSTIRLDQTKSRTLKYLFLLQTIICVAASSIALFLIKIIHPENYTDSLFPLFPIMLITHAIAALLNAFTKQHKSHLMVGWLLIFLAALYSGLEILVWYDPYYSEGAFFVILPFLLLVPVPLLELIYAVYLLGHLLFSITRGRK